MSMLSMKAKYALRALLMLAKHTDGEPVMIAEIADTQQVPKKFLELILLELKRNGIVHSLRGRHGGYALARPPAEITFGRVIRVIDGPLAPVLCASMTAYRRCGDCEDETACTIRKVFREVRDATAAILDGETLADALKRGPRGRRAEI
jgi:Rrf2 family protein